MSISRKLQSFRRDPAQATKNFAKQVQKALAGTPSDKNVPTSKPEPASDVVQYPSTRAKRPIGIFYDEFSRGMNPFGFIPTYGVADADTPIEEIKALFEQFGVVKVRGVYTPEKSKQLHAQCVDFSGLKPLDFRQIWTRKVKSFAGGAPTFNDERFWEYATNNVVSKAVKSILTDDCFEFGSSVAAHYSARGLHRDYRMLCEKDGNPYNYNAPEKKIVRVLHYCAAENMPGGQLGIIPFSFDMRKWEAQGKRIGLTKHPEWFDRHREALTHARLKKDFTDSDDIERHVVWIATDPGDVIISNSAMLHCGEHLTMPRYFFVTTYASADEDTVHLAKAGMSTEKSVDYHKHLVAQGFNGSKKVLAAFEKSVAEKAKVAAE